ncbi:MAG: cytochrome C biosynthesis protein [Shewanella sp.]|nr:cytochrome C biosynthesis protein [Shewanella sp.]MCF1431736.1 cytochrome C biosynthesis protein [Shewanella sp.]MCF1438738.1 cytochrome C biosynthesis protein [Shewanella sp.]MCF1458531.1 cytochrome C biosynthesis protein [Shewanella sp.]
MGLSWKWISPLQLLLLSFTLSVFNATAADNLWYSQTEAGQAPDIKLHFFWSKTCPHCAKAHPFIDRLTEKYPWVQLDARLVSDPGVYEHWQQIAQATNSQTTSVPFVAICGQSIVGYTSDDVTGKFIEQKLRECYTAQGGQLDPNQVLEAAVTLDSSLFGSCDKNAAPGTCDTGLPTQANSVVQPVELPFVGTIAPEQLSLPLLTLVLAGVDAFNPCAFFVLLFLLSIMVNARSRGRMLLVGGIFVFFSGLIYFLFMTAWLNLFQLLGAGGDGGTIILIAGVIALMAGAINIKEFFFHRGKVTLSMSTENRSGLIKRMGKLSSASSLWAMIVGSTVLAILANTYELLCTAGFPMIYTSVLSMHELTAAERYTYLAMYNIVYVIPLATIVIIFAATLGKRKLTEKEGEGLKLMSGTMMTGMGTLLVFDPTSMQNPVLAIGLILGSILITASIIYSRRLISNKVKRQ